MYGWLGRLRLSVSSRTRMEAFPILEIVALSKATMWVDKNSNDLAVNCLMRQLSKFSCCNRWPSSSVPARGSYLSQAVVEHVQIWIQIRESITRQKTVPHGEACPS